MELASYRVNESLCRQIVWTRKRRGVGGEKKTRRRVRWGMAECCPIFFKTLLWLTVTARCNRQVVFHTQQFIPHRLKVTLFESWRTKPVILCACHRGKSTSEAFSCGRWNKPQKSNGGNSWRPTVCIIRTKCNIRDKCRCSGAWRGWKSCWSSSCQEMLSLLPLILIKKMPLLYDKITSSQSFLVFHTYTLFLKKKNCSQYKPLAVCSLN